MGIELPSALTTPLGWIGLEWPKGDETAMFRMHGYYSQYASEVDQLIPELRSLCTSTLEGFQGPARDALEKDLEEFFSGEQQLQQLVSDAQKIASSSEVQAETILALKILFIVELTALAVSIAIFTASAVVNWGAPAEEAAEIAATRAAVKEAIDAAVNRVKKKIEELLLKELRKQLEKELENGLKDLTKKDIAKFAGKELARGAKNAGKDAMTSGALNTIDDDVHAVVQLANGQKPDLGSIEKSFVTGAMAGAVMSPASRVVGLGTSRAWNKMAGQLSIGERLTTGTSDRKWSSRAKSLGRVFLGDGRVNTTDGSANPFWGKDRSPVGPWAANTAINSEIKKLSPYDDVSNDIKGSSMVQGAGDGVVHATGVVANPVGDAVKNSYEEEGGLLNEIATTRFSTMGPG